MQRSKVKNYARNQVVISVRGLLSLEIYIKKTLNAFTRLFVEFLMCPDTLPYSNTYRRSVVVPATAVHVPI
jgi:hypothetical protein